VDLKRIEQLIDLMEKSGVTQLSLEVPDYKISITRGARECADPAPAVADASTVEIPVGAVDEKELEALEAVPVVSPVVGVFHNGGMMNPRQAVKEGARVERGRLLAAIEAMKVPNEIRAPVSGVVSKILVQDGAAVEYGQTLFLIQPEEGGEIDDGDSLVGLA
jgi:acetyl-CoA carboxylase biotin carboxyl carrier protein